jgi:hypothetical protein
MSTPMDSIDNVRKLASGELSLRARIGYVALLLGSAVMTAVIVSLWITEPHLPARARVAFCVMTLIGAAWAALSLWALTTRRVLLARDRVIAGRMAVTFTGVFVAGAATACVISMNVAAFTSLAAGLTMFGVALRVWSGARRRFAELQARRVEIERQLAN